MWILNALALAALLSTTSIAKDFDSSPSSSHPPTDLGLRPSFNTPDPFLSPPSLLPRGRGSRSRKITSCPTTAQVFIESECEGPTPQDYIVACHTHPFSTGYIDIHPQRCNDNEFCLDHSAVPTEFARSTQRLHEQIRNSPDQTWRIVECITVDDPTAAQKKKVAGRIKDAMRTPLSDRSSASGVAAVVTKDGDMQQGVDAEWMMISAQVGYELFGGAVSWRTLDGGLASCVNCGRLSLQSVPSGTDRVVVSGWLNGASGVADLYTMLVAR